MTSFFGILSSVIRPLIIFISVILLITLIAVWIGLLVGFFYSAPFADYFLPGTGLWAKLCLFNIFFILTIPISFLVIGLMKPITGGRFRFKGKIWLWSFWLLNIVSLFYVGQKALLIFNQEARVANTLNLDDFEGDTLKIMWEDDVHAENLLRIGPLRIGQNHLISHDVLLEIDKGQGESFEMIKTMEARGENMDDATNAINQVAVNHRLEGNILYLTPYFTIPAGKKWRAHQLRYNLKVPVGKFLEVDPVVNWHHIIKRTPIHAESTNPRFTPGLVWEMTDDGMRTAKQ